MKQLEGYMCWFLQTNICLQIEKSTLQAEQAPRAWFDRLKMRLPDRGFKNSNNDSSLFFHQLGTSLIIVLIYVDDILVIGNNSTLITTSVQDLHKLYAL